MIIVVGLLAMAGERYPGFRLGRLPGDIVYEKDGTRVYIPITTMIVISIGVSIGFAVLRLLKR